MHRSERPGTRRSMHGRIVGAFHQRRRDIDPVGYGQLHDRGMVRAGRQRPFDLRRRHRRCRACRSGRRCAAKACYKRLDFGIGDFNRGRDRDGRLHGQGLPWPGDDLAQRSRVRRFQHVDDLAALDLADLLAFGEIVTDFDQPLQDGALLHGRGPIWESRARGYRSQHYPSRVIEEM